MYRLYEMSDSGNCYKARLLLNQLGIDYERIPTNILQGESRTEQFLRLNPNGKVPLLVLPDGKPLAESNAILCYLAEGSELIPTERYERALALQWLFFEQYSHEPFIATNRFWIHLEGSADANAQRIAANHPKGLAALGVMQEHLNQHDFFTASNRYGIADIALYAYTHVAHQGNYDLTPFPAIGAWLQRVVDHPGHLTIDE